MTYEMIDLLAANEARLYFIDLVVHLAPEQIDDTDVQLNACYAARQKKFQSSRRCRCLRCKLVKHVDEFHRKTGTCAQSWCKACFKEEYK